MKAKMVDMWNAAASKYAGAASGCGRAAQAGGQGPQGYPFAAVALWHVSLPAQVTTDLCLHPSRPPPSLTNKPCCTLHCRVGD